ncbi:hypothetical protein [Flavobacterium sp. UBA4854]|uniref:hypothetical protein n=1 Tax=Flavobacterium sp. UBA4854 TaxID=1946548 RepID=UPI00257A8115|nr:hypothetical protein [Flavobacterium sp. UBA4854]
MRTKILNLLLILIFCFSCTAQDENDNSNKIVQRITYSTGLHNAFTDLVYFKDQFFLVYRESDKHVFGRDGVIKLLNSVDGKNWKLIKDFAVSGVDLRDPKFAVNNDKLMLYIHGSTYEDKTLVKFSDFRANFSDNWSKLENVTLDNKIKTTAKFAGNEAWPWRVTWQNGKAYTLGYNGLDIFRLYNSEDGLFFKSDSKVYSNVALPTEATIKVSPTGDFYALIRRNYASALFQKYDKEKNEFVTFSELPFTNFGGPNFVFLNDKKVLFSGSFGYVLVGIYDLETKQYKIISSFGGGDCGYPGIVIKDNFLWLSYYASYETKGGSSIYIAKINLEDILAE